MSGPAKSAQSSMGRLLVLTGIDGSGKSTTLSLLARENPDWEVGTYDPEAWVSSQALPHLEWMLKRDPREVVGHLPPVARASFLGHMILCHWDAWLRPRLESGATVLMDSFFFRFWARERAWAGEPELLANMLRNLPRVDGAVLLDVRPEIAAARKGGFDPNETGGPKDGDGARSAFVRFQEKVYVELQEACQRWSQRLAVISSNQSPETVSQMAGRAFALPGGLP